MKTPQVLGISGSPRIGGNTDRIVQEFLSAIPETDQEFVNLSRYSIESCIGCEFCRRDLTCTRFFDGMHLLYPKIESSRLLVIGSPTYNYNMTPQVKAFIDRLYPYFNFTEPRPGPYSSRLANKGKYAFVFTVCEQHDPKEAGYTVPALADALEALGYTIIGREIFPGLFSRQAASQNHQVLKRVYELGQTAAAEVFS